MVGDTAEPEGTPDTSVSVAAPVPLPVGPAVRAVAFDWVYGTEGDGLLIGAVPEGRLLFDVVPVSKGVAVALDNGYGADDDSEDAVDVGDVELSIPAEAVELGYPEDLEIESGVGAPEDPVERGMLPVGEPGATVPFERGWGVDAEIGPDGVAGAVVELTPVAEILLSVVSDVALPLV